MEYDFTGWATKANLKCADGRVIMKDAFKENDGKTVPMVWMHQHNDPNGVLGHALLENRDEGVYVYGKFNDSESGKTAKLLVQHEDINSLSIYANQLKQNMSNVIHGNIREVSLVLAGANPGAYIDSVIAHSEDTDEEAIIYAGEELDLCHAITPNDPDTEESKEVVKENKKVADEPEKKENKEETVKDVFDTLNEKQKTVVYAMIGEALKESGANNTDTENKEEEKMKHNVFDQDEKQENVLSHSDMEQIFADGKRFGSLKEAVLTHCEDNEALAHTVTDAGGNTVTYGVANVDYLFPDARNMTNTPTFISRKMDWVAKVMNGTHHSPFSRIKSMFADITMEEARAKGYMKGNQKTEEVFSLLKRTTTPTTIYKKQKMDRDDIIDITDFDVVAWLKSEMRIMLDEEIARAVLVGDGRSGASDDKINESNIRPIWTDDSLYTIKKTISVETSDDEDTMATKFIKAVIKSRKDYKGSGSPTLFMTEDMITNCLLLEDGVGRTLYEDVGKLTTKLRVKEIVAVPVMENLTRNVDGVTHTLAGIMVNLNDYNVGADKGGSVNMFDDFDIDYNQQKYLIETRCSGALTVPYSAVAFEFIPAT